MDAVRSPPVVVHIAGPQASGKKQSLSVARSGALRSRGETVALVELDQTASMAAPTLPDGSRRTGSSSR